MIVARVLLSWVNPRPSNAIVNFLYETTDPYLDFFRRILPLRFGMMDFSPIVALLALQLVGSFVSRLILSL